MQKKSFLKITLLVLLLFVFTTASAAQVTIEYWTTQPEEERVVKINELIDRFEADNPEYNIELIAVQEDDIPTRLAAGMAAGRLPDLIEMGTENILGLGHEGTLDSEAAYDVVSAIGEDEFFEGALKMLNDPSGGYFAVPFYGWVQGIWYRGDLFEERGLEAPNNWETVLKAAEEFYNPREQQYGIVLGTDRDSFARQTFTPFALSNNARIFDGDGNIIFDSPEMIETLDFYSRLAEFTPPGPNGWRDARDLYLSGRVPMMIYSSYIMGDIGIGDTGYDGAHGSIVEDLVNKTNFANTMENKSQASFGQISGLAFVKNEDEEKATGVKEFAKFLLNDQTYIEFLHMAPGGMNPVLKATAEDSRYQDHEILNAWGDTSTVIAGGLNNIGQFGNQDGIVFPEMGAIANQFIIGQSIMNITERNWSAERTAEWAEQQMENAVE